jgi:uncharacterized Zn finger protein
MVNKKEYVRACPKCGSINVKTDFSNSVVWSSGANPNFQCKACGHLGIIFPEVLKDELAKFRSKLSQKREEAKTKEPIVDAKTGYRVGLFEISIAVIVAIIMLIIGIIYALFF